MLSNVPLKRKVQVPAAYSTTAQQSDRPNTKETASLVLPNVEYVINEFVSLKLGGFSFSLKDEYFSHGYAYT